MEGIDGEGGWRIMKDEALFFLLSEALFSSMVDEGCTLPSPGRCPAPLNKELGTAAPSEFVRVASLLIYPRPSPLVHFSA